MDYRLQTGAPASVTAAMARRTAHRPPAHLAPGCAALLLLVLTVGDTGNRHLQISLLLNDVAQGDSDSAGMRLSASSHPAASPWFCRWQMHLFLLPVTDGPMRVNLVVFVYSPRSHGGAGIFVFISVCPAIGQAPGQGTKVLCRGGRTLC